MLITAQNYEKIKIDHYMALNNKVRISPFFEFLSVGEVAKAIIVKPNDFQIECFRNLLSEFCVWKTRFGTMELIFHFQVKLNAKLAFKVNFFSHQNRMTGRQKSFGTEMF